MVLNSRYKKVIKMIGGSNCDVYLYTLGEKKYVIKISGNNSIDDKVGTLIMDDYLRVRDRLECSNISVPTLRNIYLTSSIRANLVVIEDYCGKSLREILRSELFSVDNKLSFVSKCIDLVSKFPEDIPLDTNPGNLVVHNSIITFVDFIPPDPWKYNPDSAIGRKLKKIFISLNSSDYKNKKLSYYSNKFRIRRLMYHCKNICPEIEKYL